MIQPESTRSDWPRLRVMKFGGTSVRDAEAMNRVVSIVQEAYQSDKKPRVVIASACAGVTDLLVETASCCSAGDYIRAHEILEELDSRHSTILQEILGGEERGQSDELSASAREGISGEIERLRRLVEGSRLLGETTPRTVDAILATGELLSTTLLLTAFRRRSTRAERLRSSELLVTDDRHGSARPDMGLTISAVDEVLRPVLERCDVVVLQGFIGGTRDGVTTTLGRGGSDYSAALIGGAIAAEAIEIWTDVDGILTADPRIVPTARPIERISFSGARELALFGAKVIHPDTILPAVERGIPVKILNSHNPDSPGTTILPDTAEISAGFYSVTGRRNLVLLEIVVQPDSGLDPAEIISLFAGNDIGVLCSVAAESSLSVVIPEEAWREPFRTILESAVQLEVHSGAALLCLAGASVRSTPALLAGPLAALRNVPIRLLAAGSSDHSILLALEESRLEESLLELHRLLFEEG